MTERFKVSRGRMLVIPTAEPPQFRPVEIIFDSENDMVGIKLIGESPVQGFVFLVKREDIERNVKGGRPVAELEY